MTGCQRCCRCRCLFIIIIFRYFLFVVYWFTKWFFLPLLLLLVLLPLRWLKLNQRHYMVHIINLVIRWWERKTVCNWFQWEAKLWLWFDSSVTTIIFFCICLSLSMTFILQLISYPFFFFLWRWHGVFPHRRCSTSKERNYFFQNQMLSDELFKPWHYRRKKELFIHQMTVGNEQRKWNEKKSQIFVKLNRAVRGQQNKCIHTTTRLFFFFTIIYLFRFFFLCFIFHRENLLPNKIRQQKRNYVRFNRDLNCMFFCARLQHTYTPRKKRIKLFVEYVWKCAQFIITHPRERHD